MKLSENLVKPGTKKRNSQGISITIMVEYFHNKGFSPRNPEKMSAAPYQNASGAV